MNVSALKSSMARQIKGTGFEPIARKTWHLFNYLSLDTAKRQKAAYLEHAPAYMTQIISRVLTKDSNCIDVGCHGGAILSQMFSFAPLGYHYAFEPIPHLAELIKQRFPEVDLRQVALSSSAGEIDFHHIVSRPGLSGLKQRPDVDSNQKVEIIKVKTQRLDDVLMPNFKVHFIKVDVEGAELEVFKGAIRTLKTHKPYLLFEHGPISSKAYGSTPDMIYQLLVHECGLKIFGLRDWLNNSSPLDQNEFSSIQASGVMWDYLATP